MSRFLNGQKVSESARAAIQQAINRLNYRPNESARSLVTSKTNVVGVIVGNLLNTYYAELLEPIRRGLAEHGYRTLIISDSYDQPDSLEGLLGHADMDGVIVTTTLLPPLHERLILRRGIPVVSMSRRLADTHDTVTPDNEHGGRLAGEHLMALGHRRIGVIGGPPAALPMIDRQRGFAEVLAREGVHLDESLVLHADMDYDQAYAAALTLLEVDDPPTAVFLHNDRMAYAALNAARRLNLDVPGGTSVISFDDVRMSSWETFELTTVRQPIAGLAAKAIEMLVARLREPGMPPRTITLPCTLVERSTTAPPRA